MPDRSENASIDQVKRRIRARFGTVPAGDIDAAVDAALAHFDHCRIRDFIPLLVERRAGHPLEQGVTDVANHLHRSAETMSSIRRSAMSQTAR